MRQLALLDGLCFQQGRYVICLQAVEQSEGESRLPQQIPNLKRIPSWVVWNWQQQGHRILNRAKRKTHYGHVVMQTVSMCIATVPDSIRFGIGTGVDTG